MFGESTAEKSRACRPPPLSSFCGFRLFSKQSLCTNYLNQSSSAVLSDNKRAHPDGGDDTVRKRARALPPGDRVRQLYADIFKRCAVARPLTHSDVDYVTLLV